MWAEFESAGVDNKVLYSLVRRANGFKKLLAQTFLQEYTFIPMKTGILYNKIYLFIFRTLK